MKESFLCLHGPHSCCPFTCVHLGCYTSHLSFSECTLTCLVSLSLTLLHCMRRVTCSVLPFLQTPLDSNTVSVCLAFLHRVRDLLICAPVNSCTHLYSMCFNDSLPKGPCFFNFHVPRITQNT